MPDKQTPEPKTQRVAPHTSVCVRFLDEASEGDLLRGIVVESKDDTVRVCVSERLVVRRGTLAEVFYRNESHAFVRITSTVSQTGKQGRHYYMDLALQNDQSECAEQRSTFRVPVAEHAVELTLDKDTDSRPLDVSAEGMGVVTPVQLKDGQYVRVTLKHKGKRAAGTMSVRTARKRKDGQYRVGLSIIGSSKELAGMLQQMSMTIQRQMLSQMAQLEQEARQQQAKDQEEADSLEASKEGRPKPAAPDAESVPKPVPVQANDGPAAPKPVHHNPATPRPVPRERPNANFRPSASEAPGEYLVLHLSLSENVGKRVPIDLLNQRGQVMIARNEKLTENDLQQISSGELYIHSEDWDTATSTLKPVAGTNTSDKGDERRINRRRNWHTKIVVECQHTGFVQTIEANTVDLSRGGYSFQTRHDIPVGVKVFSNIDIGGIAFEVSGVVVYSEKVKKSGCRVGVRFSEVVGGKQRTPNTAGRLAG